MKIRRILWNLSILLIIMGLLLSACSRGEGATTATVSDSNDDVSIEAGQSASGDSETTTSSEDTPEAPTATPEPTFPELLPLHPDAYDLEILTTTDTYIYYVPMMVAETAEYLLPELEALEWQALGKPAIMGHLATVNMQREGYRLTISMQDNDHTQATRIQMILIEQ